MTTPPLELSDPLREARRAVQAGEFRRGWAQLQRVPEELRAAPEWLLLAAMARWRLGDFLWARATAVRARDLFRARGDADGEMRAENVAAAGAFAVGDLDDAERGFQRALGIARELDEPLMAARCANNLGNVAYYLARHPTALSYYRRALVGFEQVGFRKGLAEAWLNTAVTQKDAGQLENAREAGDRAVLYADACGDQRILAQALVARGETDLARGDVELARVQSQTAEQLAAAHDDPVTQADAIRVLAGCARVSGEVARAAQLARDAWAAVEPLAHPWTHAEIQRELGVTYTASGDRPAAQEAFRRAADAFERAGSRIRARAMRERAALVAR